MKTSAELTQQLYLAYLGRPADPAELANWSHVLDRLYDDPALVVQAFSRAEEYQSTYADLSSAGRVIHLFPHLFARAATSSEVQMWSERLDNRLVSAETLPWLLQSVARGADAETLTIRTEAAQALTSVLAASGQALAMTEPTWVATAKAWISSLSANDHPADLDLAAWQLLQDGDIVLPPVSVLDTPWLLPDWLDHGQLTLDTSTPFHAPLPSEHVNIVVAGVYHSDDLGGAF